MCRVVAVKSTTPIQLAHLLTRPRHSIINQSFDSRLRLDLRRPINGDGFGVGWYDAIEDAELGSQPCIFKSIAPAWNDENLTMLAVKIKSPLVFGHVRATTAGSLSQDNCHPWSYGKLMFMHNGGIAQFEKIKRKLHAALPDKIFHTVKGNTDSEWAFALYLSKIPNIEDEATKSSSFTPDVLRKAMLETLAHLNTLAREAGITEPSLLNFTITDGSTIVASRYISSKFDEAASLYFSSGTTFHEEAPGDYKMTKSDKRENIIMVASEPLTFEKADWMEIKTNTMIVITPKMNILQIPIIDEFSTSSTSSKRDVQFATEKGLWTQNPRRATLPSPAPSASPSGHSGPATAIPVVGVEEPASAAPYVAPPRANTVAAS